MTQQTRNHKVHSHFGANEYYAYYVKNGGTLTRKQFGDILKDLNLSIAEQILDGYSFKMPSRIGVLSVTKKKEFVDFKDGKAVTETATTEATTGGASKSLTGLPALIAEAKKDARVAKKETRLIAGGLSQAVAEWVTSSSTPIKTANQALKGLEKNQTRTVKRLTNLYNGSAAGQQAAAQAAAEASQAAAQAAAEFARVQAEAAAAEAAALAERERVYNSFLDSVKNTFAGIKNAILGAFDITGLGSSTNSILRNMEKMLVKLRSFSASVKQLATMGLDPALLQQIISMGPMAGATLASRLVQGGAGALSAINAGFGEFGSLAGEIATTGTESLFNRESQKTQFTINVSGGVGSGATIGKAIVDAIKDYERTSGAVWQGA